MMKRDSKLNFSVDLWFLGGKTEAKSSEENGSMFVLNESFMVELCKYAGWLYVCCKSVGNHKRNASKRK